MNFQLEGDIDVFSVFYFFIVFFSFLFYRGMAPMKDSAGIASFENSRTLASIEDIAS